MDVQAAKNMQVIRLVGTAQDRRGNNDISSSAAHVHRLDQHHKAEPKTQMVVLLGDEFSFAQLVAPVHTEQRLLSGED